MVDSYGSVTSVSEEFLLNIILPIRDNCKYAVNSTDDFKTALLEHRHTFDQEYHEICSYHAQSLYTNININRTISYVLDEIYKNPSSYFKTETDAHRNNIDLVFPPRDIFKRFFYDTLVEFSSFSTVAGYYKQIQGLPMGSRLNPILADLFMNLMEESYIIGNKNVVFYKRYIDEILVIQKKGNMNTTD